MCLAEGDAIGILMHLDAKVEAEEAEVTHVEDPLHLCLERPHFSILRVGDDQVVDVDADEQDRASTARRYIAAS
jgi:hypothetical protein